MAEIQILMSDLGVRAACVQARGDANPAAAFVGHYPKPKPVDMVTFPTPTTTRLGVTPECPGSERDLGVGYPPLSPTASHRVFGGWHSRCAQGTATTKDTHSDAPT